jgi:hypothetical protein
VKAVQHRDGSWSPHTTTGKRDGEYIPWSRKDLQAHVSGVSTFGHYLLTPESTCKLFAFDIDLREQGFYPKSDDPWTESWENDGSSPEMVPFNPREAWKDRTHPSRPYLKYELKTIANTLMSSIHKELEFECAAAYSGGKGVHVYGFMPPEYRTARDCRLAAISVLEDFGQFERSKNGDVFWQTSDQDSWRGHPNIEIEAFPKQDSLEGKSLGNLMRLPLGRNLKSKDPTFFLDMTSPVGEMRPVDPVFALTTKNPWRRPGE